MKNWKGVLAILLMSVLSLGFSLSAFAAETGALQLKSKSAVLMDAGTGTILYEKNSHEAMPPASVTKVMTLLLIYEAEAAGQFGWEETSMRRVWVARRFFWSRAKRRQPQS